MTDNFRTRKLLDEQFLILRIRPFPSSKALVSSPYGPGMIASLIQRFLRLDFVCET